MILLHPGNIVTAGAKQQQVNKRGHWNECIMLRCIVLPISRVKENHSYYLKMPRFLTRIPVFNIRLS